MIRYILFICLALPLCTTAQKKTFTFQELFKGEYPKNIINNLPFIDGWADGEHYLEMRKELMSVNVRTGEAVPYTRTEPKTLSISGARNITLSPDGKYVAYTKKNNLYVQELATEKETALTTDGSDVIMNGYASWVYYEEILGRASDYKAFWWSPDSKRIVYMRFDDSKVPVFPIYISKGTHGYLENTRYPKAGDPNPEVRIGITPVDRVATVWADFNAADDQYFGTPDWSPANELWIQWMNRGQDTLITYKINPDDGSRKEIYRETQSTWIDLDETDRFAFLNNKNFIVKSTKDGWENLYLYNANGKLLNQITKGNFWGTTILHIDEKNQQVYITARKEHSARFDVYKVSFNGKTQKRLTFGDYSHDRVSMSPNGKYFITTYSNLSTPPVMAVVDNEGKVVRELAQLKGTAFNDYFIPESRYVTVKSSDGLFDLPMIITYPQNFDSTKKYPVWISVYGGPNAGTVYDRWKPASGTSQWWAQEGVIQVAMDNRSSGHFGKNGLNYIYKQLGKYEIEDYMTCGKWLRAQPWVNADKIGINGGSFGGYITCMALTYGADVFTHGIANYSVTDWKLYDTHYTERFMKTPQQNPTGYATTAVTKYINKYKGVLRIVHGDADDNVHMQNSMQLIDALEDANKSFELMIYPGQRHGIRPPKAMHNLMETMKFVDRYLLER